MTVTTEDETATGIALMTGTAGTSTEVSCSAPFLSFPLAILFHFFL